jgi:hypothetical protein
MIVDPNGRHSIRPNSLNLTSPGIRPTPNLIKPGNKAEKTSNPIKMTATQRIMHFLSKLREPLETGSLMPACCAHYFNKRPPKKIKVDSNIVDANGKKMVFPNSVNRMSPGKRPTPNFSSQGSAAEKMTRAIKIVRVQRIMHCLLKQSDRWHAANRMLDCTLKNNVSHMRAASMHYRRLLLSLRMILSGSSMFLPMTSTLNNSPISAGEVSFCTAFA